MPPRTINRVKKIEVDPEFYEIFSEDEQVGIINDLEFKRQIKDKYSYFKKGAISWDEFYFSSPITSTFEDVKDVIFRSILYLINHCDNCNVIDIGPGNAHPVKGWLEELNQMEILSRYVSVDISQDINDIVGKNIKEWLPDLDFREYIKDIQLMEMARVFIENKVRFEGEDSRTANIVLHLGNTICNHDDRFEVLKNINRGMDVDDLFVFSYTTDKESNKIQHKYISGLKSLMWLPEALGIDMKKSKEDTAFDHNLNAKTRYIQLDSDYELIFDIFGGKKKILLRKGERVDIGRVYLINFNTLLKEIDEAGMELVTIQYDKTKSYAIAVCRTKDPYNQRESV